MAGIAAPFDFQPRLKLQPRPGTGQGNIIGPPTSGPGPTVIPTGATGGGAPGGMTLGGTFPPVTTAPPTVTTTTTITGTSGQPIEVGGEGPIYIDVVNTIQNTVNAATQAGTDATNGVISAITGPLNQTINDINTGVGNAFSAIAQTLNDFNTGIGGLLNNINSLISNGILGTIASITQALAGILGQISSQIGGLAGAIAQAIAQVIPVIVAAISNPIAAVTGVLRGIEQAITGNIAALTQVGSDISGGFTGLDSTLGRLLTSYESFTEATTGYPDGGSLHHDLSTIASTIAGLASANQYNPAPALADFLQPTCISDYLDELRKKPWLPPNEPIWALEAPAFIGAKLLASVVSWAFSVFPAAAKANIGGQIIMNQQCPQGLLNPSALVDAARRGYLSYDQAALEALKGDLDETRFHTLYDLATQQLPVQQLVDAIYRGAISPDQFNTALAQQGYTGDQQALLQALGNSLLSTAELTALYRRQNIDVATFDKALQALHYDDAQRKALIGLSFRPANMQEAIDGGAAQDTLAQMGALAESDVNRIPEYISVAAAAEGLSVDAMNQRWLSHWSTGSVASWINLYFRGVISLGTVQAAMSRNFIPASLQTTLIESARPLIQFRTISNMLRIGQIDVQQAGQMLLQHGYTPENAQLLITYAQRPGAAVKEKQAKATHAVSLGIAKQEYTDGSISENDYYQILIAHGYTIEGANAEIAVVNAQQAMLNRKDQAQFVVDEYGAGLIDEQTALAQLASIGLTVFELAKYAHKIRAFRTKRAKIPSETDLNHFLQLGIIDAHTYTTQLQAQGYSDTASGWFLAWRQHPTATSAPPTPTTPTTSG